MSEVTMLLQSISLSRDMWDKDKSLIGTARFSMGKNVESHRNCASTTELKLVLTPQIVEIILKPEEI